MASEVTTELRIYCICGQKMRVSEAMFGLPGKCVACRQKIRVPRADELPQGASEIYLKDHPEFLRKGKHRSPAPEATAEAEEAETEDITLDRADNEAVSIAILDVLEPLRVLCSLQHKIERQINALETGAQGARDAVDADALNAYLDRVRRARAEMDEQLRQRLMETAIDLSSTQEKIVQIGLSARIGEVSFADFRDTIDRLRRRRERLERLQQNLRGWLTVSDPHSAGGYTNVSFDSIPSGGLPIILAPEDEDPRSLVDQHVGGLREAFVRRERANLRLRETERLSNEGNMSLTVLADCQADCESEQRRADAEVSFRRKRLEALSQDAAMDIQSIQACLEQARATFREGKLDKPLFQVVERDLQRTQRDCAQVHDLVSRALLAGSARDLPEVKGTFLRRLARPVAPQPQSVEVEKWIAWGSALAMGLSVFLPVVGDLSPLAAFHSLGFGGDTAHWTMVLPVVAGVLIMVASLLPSRSARGLALAGLFVVLATVGMWLVHEAGYGSSAIAARFRQGGYWLFRPGLALMTLASLGTLVAAAVALQPVKKLRAAVVVAFVIGTAIGIAFVTDFGGAMKPYPMVNVTDSRVSTAAGDEYDTTVSISNTGRRTLVLTTTDNTAVSAFRYGLERQTEGGTWAEVEAAPRVVASGAGSDGTLYGKAIRSLRVAPGETTVFRYMLAPGSYRVYLSSVRNATEAIVTPFELAGGTQPIAVTLPEPPPQRQEPAQEPLAAASPANNSATPPDQTTAAPPTPIADPSTSAPVDSPEDPVPPEPADDETSKDANVTTGVPVGVEAELRGVITGGNRQPRFLIAVSLPDGTEKSFDLELGDALYDPWMVSEFNPLRQTVTLAAGNRILILRRGERISLSGTP